MQTNRLGIFATVVSSLSFFSYSTFAQPVLNPDNGHYYEVVPVSGITWAQANAAANASSTPIDPTNPASEYVPGHLVTIDSDAELAFVETLRSGTTLAWPEVWIGAYQQDPAAAPGDTWEWVDGTPLSGEDPNWQPGEPDDQGGPESFATLGQDFGKPFYVVGYNDETSANKIGGYVREFDISSLDECQSQSGCKGPKGLKIVVPSTAELIDENFGGAVGFVTTEILDPRIELNPDGSIPEEPICDGSVLSVLDGLGSLPGYLCGSPYIKIVHAIASNVRIPYGTVFAEAEQLESNGGEAGPYRCNPGPGSDPRRRGRMAFQTTALRASDGQPDMFENLLANVFYGNDGSIGPLPTAEGIFPSAGPFTAGCASSFGELKSKSIFFVGTHAQCNRPDDYPWESSSFFVTYCFVLLADNKAGMLEQAVQRAYDAGVISRGDYRKLMTQAEQGRTQLLQLHVDEAIAHYENFYSYAVNQAEFDTELDLGVNHFGEQMMRLLNLLFILQTDIMPNL